MNENEKLVAELLMAFKKLSPDGKEEVILTVESLKGGKKMADALRMIADNEAAGQTKKPSSPFAGTRASNSCGATTAWYVAVPTHEAPSRLCR